MRAEHYIAAHPGRRLTEHTRGDVDAYLVALGRNTGLKARSSVRPSMLNRNCSSWWG